VLVSVDIEDSTGAEFNLAVLDVRRLFGISGNSRATV